MVNENKLWAKSTPKTPKLEYVSFEYIYFYTIYTEKAIRLKLYPQANFNFSAKKITKKTFITLIFHSGLLILLLNGTET